jgi:type 1 glutamine amidotransferase
MTKPMKRINCALVVGGKYHDMDFARLKLLTLLGENVCIRTRVFENYDAVADIVSCDFLITYTCDVTPSLEAQEALRRYVAGGRRWFALHGTNSILRFLENGKVDSPRWAPHLMETLGSMFIAHPPIEPYRVEPTAAGIEHPLTKGIEPFTTTDELYLMETYAPLEVLMHAEFEGAANSFVENRWPHRWHPVMYLRPLARGAVLYLTLGHCRGHFDLQPVKDFWPQLDRGSWEMPVFMELVRRSIAWAIEPAEAQPAP